MGIIYCVRVISFIMIKMVWFYGLYKLKGI
jgi:hypothetical protein